jgi:WD40 repeat protein
MYARRVVLIAVLCLSASKSWGAPGSALRPPTVDLRWEFEKSKTFYLKITTRARQTMKVMSNEVDQSQTLTFYLSWTPLEKKGDTWRIRQKIEGYDSTEKKTSPNDPLNKVFKTLVDSETVLILDVSKEKVVQIEGRKELLDKLRVVVPQAPQKLLDYACKKALTEVVEQFLIALVGKRVEAADGFALYNPRKGRIEHQSVRFDVEGILEIEIDGQPTKAEFWQIQEFTLETSDGSLLKHGTAGITRTEPLRRKPRSTDPQDIGWSLPEELFIPPPSSPEERALGAAFSPDGRILATGGQDIRLWNPQTRKLIRRFGKNLSSFGVLAFSPDGRFIFSNGGFTGTDRKEDGQFCDICMWEVSTGKIARKFHGHWNVIKSLAVSPDGKTLVSASADASIRIWDVATARELPTPFRRPMHEGTQCRWLSFSSDGKLLATCVEEEPVHLWDFVQGRELRQLHHVNEKSREPVSLNTMTFSPDGGAVAAGVRHCDKAICFWDVKSGRFLNGLTTVPASTSRSIFLPICSLGYSPDGKILASTNLDRTIRLWEVASGTEFVRWNVPQGAGWVGFSPKGRTLAALTNNGSLVILEWGRRYLMDAKLGRETHSSELAKLWNLLASSDARTAFHSVQELIARRGIAVDFLEGQLQAIPAATPGRLAELVKALDDRDFPVREHAFQELARLAEVAEPALREVVTNSSSLEMQRRADRLLKQLAGPASPEHLRCRRSVMVLEYIGTPEARRVLDKLADKVRRNRASDDASAACLRLNGRGQND